MPTSTPRRTSRDWAVAAYDALATAGPSAVTVEGVARRLGVTKGSFYWHFGAREDLLVAALGVWRDHHTDAVIRHADSAGDAAGRLRRLLHAVAGSPVEHGEVALYAQGRSEPAVAAALRQVSETRIAYVRDLLLALGVPADDAALRAELALALVIGHRVLFDSGVRTTDPAGTVADAAFGLLVPSTDA